MDNGGRSAMMNGIEQRQMSFADNWAILPEWASPQ